MSLEKYPKKIHDPNVGGVRKFPDVEERDYFGNLVPDQVLRGGHETLLWTFFWKIFQSEQDMQIHSIQGVHGQGHIPAKSVDELGLVNGFGWKMSLSVDALNRVKNVF